MQNPDVFTPEKKAPTRLCSGAYPSRHHHSLPTSHLGLPDPTPFLPSRTFFQTTEGPTSLASLPAPCQSPGLQVSLVLLLSLDRFGYGLACLSVLWKCWTWLITSCRTSYHPHSLRKTTPPRPQINKSEVCEGEKESAPASHSHSTADTLSVLHVGGGGGFGVPPVLCGQGTQEPPTILP